MSDAIIQCRNLAKTFHDGANDVKVLQAVNLELKRGELVAILGASGSGKSTLLHCLGALDDPSEGQVLINGIDIHSRSEKEQGKIRNKYLGFVYQFHHLLPEFTALENVAMPLMVRGMKRQDAQEKALKVIDKVKLTSRAEHKPGELSGGERQRIALARALAGEPSCVLADEPTGNLDPETAQGIYELIAELNKELGTTFLLVTHDQELAGRMNRRLRMQAGRLEAVD